VANKRHRIFLRYTQRLALREFHRSCQTIPVKKQFTKTRTVNDKGENVEVRLEEYLKPQYGRNPYLGTAARASHELTVLAAGYFGPGNGSIECDKIIDPEERDRWDRAVKSRTRRVKRLQEKLAAAEQELAAFQAAGGKPASGSETVPVAASDPEVVDLRLLGVSRIAEKDPAAYQKYADEFVTSKEDGGTCGKPSDTRPTAKSVSKGHSSPPRRGAPRLSAGRRVRQTFLRG
jgi:hypothetical protein